MLAQLIAAGALGGGGTPTPTPSGDFADFIEVFPAFAAISETAFDFWYEQAGLITASMEACLGARYQLATWLVTAHYLTQNGLGSGAEAQAAAQGATSFSRIKSGSLELERGKNDAAAAMGDWGTTSYGQRVYPMLKACVGGPRVTGTGSVCVGGFNGFAGPLPPWH